MPLNPKIKKEPKNTVPAPDQNKKPAYPGRISSQLFIQRNTPHLHQKVRITPRIIRHQNK